MRAAVLAALLLAACSDAGQADAAASAAGQIGDQPSGPVADAADIIPPADEASIDRDLRAYVARTGTAIIVASVDTLGGQTVEQVAFDTYNNWGIGDPETNWPETNRGVLILVAPNERRVRIEVGCGLESVITNAAAKHVIEQDMIPLFRSGDYAAGVNAGVGGLKARLANSQGALPVSRDCLATMQGAA